MYTIASLEMFFFFFFTLHPLNIVEQCEYAIRDVFGSFMTQGDIIQHTHAHTILVLGFDA